jgi:hypothetical protein
MMGAGWLMTRSLLTELLSCYEGDGCVVNGLGMACMK